MRIRTVKPEFWSHPIMARLPATTQLLALALLNHADDHGYFMADPAIIRGACFPFRDDLANLREDFARLLDVGWVEVAKHPTQGEIGFVVNWSKHQKVDHPRDSRIKTYFIRENLAKPRDNFALDQGSGIRDQGGDQGVKSDPPQDIFQGMDQDEIELPIAKPMPPVVPLRGLPDFLAMHPRLRFKPEERVDVQAALRLWGWEAFEDGMTTLAKTTPKGQPIWRSMLMDWISQHYELDPKDTADAR